ncbi:MAG: hypothetical protein OEY49_01215 [Candidatus Heimdallarchaeota archaeon]|nr:hypothetical protein [Candidatus Heimdallarchaeota archaeon]
MKKIILGIHDGHGAGAALSVNGRIVAAVSEERIVNIKNYSGVPIHAIKEVYKITNINPEDTSAIAIVGLVRTLPPVSKEDASLIKVYKRFARYLSGKKVTKAYISILHKYRKMSELRELFKSMNISDKEIFFIEHHKAHAACALYQHPNGQTEDKLILTLDGAGDGLSATVSIGNIDGIKRIASTTAYHSIANNIYSEMTGFLGLKRWEHEYKLMGMAPYGREEYCYNNVNSLVGINPKNPLEFKNYSGAYSNHLQKKFSKLFVEQRFDNLAAATQKVFEENVVKWVKNSIKETGIYSIACAGGAFLNVKANSLIRELSEVSDPFFYPVADDNGTPIGACLEVYRILCDRDGIKPIFEPIESLYLGREFSNSMIENELKNYPDLHFTYIEEQDIPSTIANELVDGKIIARFKGKEEFGPRALGNRTINADPRDLRVIRKINFAIKQRDFWMPFAPSILETDIQDYFINSKPARYMIESFQTTSLGNDIIAACHPFDMTARPQTVNAWNTSYLNLITQFKEQTGVSAVLNTSFNLHGFPIVGSPKIAIDTFNNSMLDGLLLENYYIKRSN